VPTDEALRSPAAGDRAEHEAAQGSGFLDALAALHGRSPAGPISGAIARACDPHRFSSSRPIEPAAFRTHYRQQLDAAPRSGPEHDTFLAEMTEAHQLNIAMVAELKQRWPS
jgi:hypothetical protein